VSIHQGRVGAVGVGVDERLVSIHQGRVGLRGKGRKRRRGAPYVSIHQGRVGLRGPSTSSWGAPPRSVHPSGPRRPPRRPPTSMLPKPALEVSIHQGRVGLRGVTRDTAFVRSIECPSIRAASASAAIGLRDLREKMGGCVHPSGPRRPPRPASAQGNRGAALVSIHQGRVGLRGPSSRRMG